eukprot:5796151-Prymnesium_polylepis.1
MMNGHPILINVSARVFPCGTRFSVADVDCPGARGVQPLVYAGAIQLPWDHLRVKRPSAINEVLHRRFDTNQWRGMEYLRR